MGSFQTTLEFLSLFLPRPRKGKLFDLSAPSQQTLELGQTPRTEQE